MGDTPWQRQVKLIKELQAEVRVLREYVAKLEKALGISGGSSGSRYISGIGWLRSPRKKPGPPGRGPNISSKPGGFGVA